MELGGVQEDRAGGKKNKHSKKQKANKQKSAERKKRERRKRKSQTCLALVLSGSPGDPDAWPSPSTQASVPPFSGWGSACSFWVGVEAGFVELRWWMFLSSLHPDPPFVSGSRD